LTTWKNAAAMSGEISRWEASSSRNAFAWAAGLLADQQQVGDLLERGVLGEIGDLVAAVDQLGLVDRADGGVAGGLAGEAAGVGGLGGGGVLRGGFDACGHGSLTFETSDGVDAGVDLDPRSATTTVPKARESSEFAASLSC